MDNIYATPADSPELSSETLNAGSVDGTGATATSVDEFDADKVDNIAQLRGYAKSLKSDLSKYKPTHEFVESTFGNTETAKLAHQVFSTFAGEEFDADNFYKTLEQLSPQRSKQLFEKYAAEQAKTLAQTEAKKLFGDTVTPEEIRLFKQFKESGYGLGQEEDIPEALKFNSDGTPKSDEEIEFLRNMQRTIKERNQKDAQEAEQAQLLEQQERENAIQESINTFSNERVKILDNEFKTYGLLETPTDTAEQRQEKSILRDFIINGVSGAFLKDPQGAKDYSAAIQHIQRGEALLARRYEPRIEAKLIEIMRSKAVGRLLSALTNEDPQPEVRPEISNSGASQGSDTPKGRISADDIFKSLVEGGQIKV